MSKDMWKEADKIHKIWHKFCSHMSKWYYVEEKYNGKTYKEFDSTQLLGYEAMTRVEKYAKNHPEIKVVRVDDSVYSGSDLVLVPHPRHGITMIFIPQNTGVNNEWFLYPGHIESLQQALDEMNKEYDGFMSDMERKYLEQQKEIK